MKPELENLLGLDRDARTPTELREAFQRSMESAESYEQALGKLLEGKISPQPQVDELRTRLAEARARMAKLRQEAVVFDELDSLTR